jgi:trehalose synthase
MSLLPPPWEVKIEPADPYRFREVIGNSDSVLDDEWSEFEGAMRCGREVLRGRTVWNVNSTAAGGGVAEMLRSLMAYARGAGVDARWVVVPGTPEFFQVTKRLHNLMHGEPGDGGRLDEAARAVYLGVNRRNAEGLAARVRPDDVVILHDPQTAGMVHALKRRGALVIWRSHIGTEQPNELVDAAWHFLLPHAQAADARVFSRHAYVPPCLRSMPTGVIAPSIDPLSPKNQPMALPVVHAVLHRAGLVDGLAPVAEPVFRRGNGAIGRVTRACQVIREGGPPALGTPLIVQVSRWDRLKDPVGVMLGFAHHAVGTSDAHLLLAGPVVEGVADDPEGMQTLVETVAAWRRLPPATRRRIHLACLPMDDLEENAAVVNALQRHAAVVVQKSLREGFGLTVTEAMWKGRPVVASKLGGVRKQVEDGISGLLVEDPSDLAAFGALLRRVLRDATLARRLGEAAYRRARQRFLHTHHLAMWVTFLARLLGPRESAWPNLDSSAVLLAGTG